MERPKSEIVKFGYWCFNFRYTKFISNFCLWTFSVSFIFGIISFFYLLLLDNTTYELKAFKFSLHKSVSITTRNTNKWLLFPSPTIRLRIMLTIPILIFLIHTNICELPMIQLMRILIFIRDKFLIHKLNYDNLHATCVDIKKFHIKNSVKELILLALSSAN